MGKSRLFMKHDETQVPYTHPDMEPGAWIFPLGFNAEEQALCRVLLAGSGDPQSLLDELAGQMTNPARHTPIANPIGYLQQLRLREDAAQAAHMQRAMAVTPPHQGREDD